MAGTLFVVATPIGNLEDLSARALRVLRSVQVIAAEDTRHTAHLLQHFGLTTPLTSLHEHNEATKSAALLQRLQEGDDVAVVSDAGTPGISDPGQQLVREAHLRGIRVEPVPGPSAVAAAVSACGFAGDGFVFLGFPPTKPSDRREWIGRLRASARIVPVAVFYEAPHRVQTTLAELAREFPDVEVLVARELTKVHEDIRYGQLANLVEAAPRGEYTIVVNIGHVTDADASPQPPGAVEMALEFGEMTSNPGVTRRQAISSLSRKYALPARTVYALIEEGRSSGR
jgi:16S rRNA (cytidine1402-2'-O)-methyltransferase